MDKAGREAGGGGAIAACSAKSRCEEMWQRRKAEVGGVLRVQHGEQAKKNGGAGVAAGKVEIALDGLFGRCCLLLLFFPPSSSVCRCL
jgi:hypothetical protein